MLFESILEPADMGNTTYGKVPEKLETMFIPINDTYYKHPLGIFDAYVTPSLCHHLPLLLPQQSPPVLLHD